MNASVSIQRREVFSIRPPARSKTDSELRARRRTGGLPTLLSNWTDIIAPCPWGAHAGLHGFYLEDRIGAVKRPLYTPEERVRRDQTPWTLVQGVLAPIQFLAFAISLGLVLRFLGTGQGYVIATVSILIKTLLLYTIMITGSIWEKKVFGKWLFAHAFFWEDMVSMLVLALQTAYLAALILKLSSPQQTMMIAVAAYAAYAINATQFVLKLRAARLEAPPKSHGLQSSFEGA